MARLPRDVVEAKAQEATAASAERTAGADHPAIPETTATAAQPQHEPVAVAPPDEPAPERGRRSLSKEPELNFSPACSLRGAIARLFDFQLGQPAAHAFNHSLFAKKVCDYVNNEPIADRRHRSVRVPVPPATGPSATIDRPLSSNEFPF